MLVIASRGSQLALWQARWVERQLTAAGFACRIEIVKTTGDKITDVPLAKGLPGGLCVMPPPPLVVSVKVKLTRLSWPRISPPAKARLSMFI